MLNLPGVKGYCPDLPWVMKLRWDKHLATEVYAYVDNCRVVGFCREICWAAAQRLASVCTRYEVQDKTAKQTFPTPTLDLGPVRSHTLINTRWMGWCWQGSGPRPRH